MSNVDFDNKARSSGLVNSSVVVNAEISAFLKSLPAKFLNSLLYKENKELF